MGDEKPPWDVVRSRDGRIAVPLDTATEELIAIGAALAANCEPCLRYHVHRGVEAGCTLEAMRRAVEIAHAVKATPARLLARLADRLLVSSMGPQGGGGPCVTAAGSSAGISAGSCCGPTPDPDKDTP
jgi:AhpD family alkylhydroperoxidase